MNIKIHSSWQELDLESLIFDEDFNCPLCGFRHPSYHTRIDLTSYMYYCCLHDVSLSGWDNTIYQDIKADPRQIDLDRLNTPDKIIVKRKLIKTMPQLIAAKIKKDKDQAEQIAKEEAERNRPLTMDELKEIIAEQGRKNRRRQPEFDPSYWTRVGDAMGVGKWSR